MKVLLIGDSIRMFYQNAVKEKLGADYEVYAPEENCRFSLYVLNSLRFWLAQFPTPDVIHWNVGLWDLAILYPQDGCFISKEVYVDAMRKILRELRKTGATLIFATTTPVSDEKQFFPGPMPPANRNSDIEEYNAAVLKMIEEEGGVSAINDLYALMAPEKEKYLSDDMIHPNDAGVDLLASAVANAIRAVKTVNTRADDHEIISGKREEKTIQ